MLLIRFENIFVIALFVMEGPAAVLTAKYLAVLVDGVSGLVEPCRPSAFREDGAVALHSL